MNKDALKARIQRAHIVDELLSRNIQEFDQKDLEKDYSYMDTHLDMLTDEGFLEEEGRDKYSVSNYQIALEYKGALKQL